MKAKRVPRPGLRIPRSIRRLFPHLTEVVDSRRSVRVSVTAADCTKGRKLQAAECALAQAAKRQYQASGAVIGLSYSYIIQGKRATRFKTPESVAREIVSYDCHNDFAPGDYALSAVPPAARLGAASERVRSGSHHVSRIVHKHTVRVRVANRGT